jgi:hypothetical protein
MKYEAKFNKTKALASKSPTYHLFEAICKIAQFDPRYIGSHCTVHPDRICVRNTGLVYYCTECYGEYVEKHVRSVEAAKARQAAHALAEESARKDGHYTEKTIPQSIISFAQPNQFPSATTKITLPATGTLVNPTPVVTAPTVPPPIHICCRDEHKNISIYGEAVLEYQGKWYCGQCAINIE